MVHDTIHDTYDHPGPFLSIQTDAGDINVAAIVIATMGLDVFTQMIQISLTTAIFG